MQLSWFIVLTLPSQSNVYLTQKLETGELGWCLLFAAGYRDSRVSLRLVQAEKFIADTFLKFIVFQSIFIVILGQNWGAGCSL